MTVTAVGIDSDTVLEAGDMVRVSEDARDNQGYTSGRARGNIGRLDFLDSTSGWYVRPVDTGSFAAYVAAQYLTKVSEADILREQVDTLTAKLATTVTERVAAQTALAAFKDRVRDTARTVVDESDNDEDDEDTELMNKLLEAVDLEPLQREFEVTVSFNGSYTTSVLARSEDEAREEIDYSSIAEYIMDSDNVRGIIDNFRTEVTE